MMQDSSLENKPLYFYRGMDVKDLRSCHEEESKEINEKGYDIYWCLQSFKGGRRTKDNIEFLRWVVADFDNITLDAIGVKFRLCPHPTMVVKTGKGFHCYWKIKNPVFGSATLPDEYREFFERSLVPLGADPNAKDISRILRVPFSRYWQDSKGNRYENQEIYCEVIYDDGPEWTWEQLQRLFTRRDGVGRTFGNGKSTIEREHGGGVSGVSSTQAGGESFWGRANRVDVRTGIEALSGSSYCRGQRFTFIKQGKITRVLVDGKPSNAWIDQNGRFGSTYENTAGTLVNFLKFPEYGLSNADIALVFKEVFGVE